MSEDGEATEAGAFEAVEDSDATFDRVRVASDHESSASVNVSRVVVELVRVSADSKAVVQTGFGDAVDNRVPVRTGL